MATKTKIVQIDGRNYRISELPLMVARDVMFNYPTTLLPKIGNYGENERLFKLLMKYVEVQPEPDKNPDWWIRLDTEESINQNVSAKGVIQLEKEVIDFSTDFFSSGKLTQIGTTLGELARNILTNIVLQSIAELSGTDIVSMLDKSVLPSEKSEDTQENSMSTSEDSSTQS